MICKMTQILIPEAFAPQVLGILQKNMRRKCGRANNKFCSVQSTCRAAEIAWLTIGLQEAARDVRGCGDLMPYAAETKRHFDFQMQNFLELEDQKVDSDSASVRLTAGVTRWWAGGDSATLPEPTSSHANCLKTRRLPPVG